MSTTIQYTENALVLTIPTACPAALHYSMMRGLITALKHQLMREERVDEEVDGLATLADLLSKVMPTEMHLVKSHSPAA